MKSSAKKVKLASVDDLFSTEESRQDAGREKVVEIALSELHPFPNHPFQVRDDDSMKEAVESVKEYGILTPAIVRPRDEGGYGKPSGGSAAPHGSINSTCRARSTVRRRR
mgnify:CR=1 FL=1